MPGLQAGEQWCLSLVTSTSNKTTPLVEAARAEKAQQWVGLAFGRSFDNRRDVPFSADLVRPYTKHRKSGYESLLPGIVLDWPRTWRKEYKTSAVPTLERLSNSGKVHEYYKCAIEFVRESDRNSDWWKTYTDGRGNAKDG
ncbi:MAG: hypothetical protein DMF61_14980 [Blastocatellia bacterium AA13]|nr:MAG: hypothetical protein DMF61_14980 [Blastocatellia bacterium AA13]